MKAARGVVRRDVLVVLREGPLTKSALIKATGLSGLQVQNVLSRLLNVGAAARSGPIGRSTYHLVDASACIDIDVSQAPVPDTIYPPLSLAPAWPVPRSMPAFSHCAPSAPQWRITG